jgi:DNA-binding transcriptional LysR family regulator
MILDSISITQLRTFESVFRTKSMTASARELHLTQSGISQHVKWIEGRLGVRLFDRVKARLIPTHSAALLYPHCLKAISELESALASVSGMEKSLSGTVRVGMPVEFGNNRVIPALAEFSRRYPSVLFEVSYGIAAEFGSRLLEGSLDFALIDDFRLSSAIHSEPVYQEAIHLCAAAKPLKGRKALLPAPNAEFFESLSFVDYDSKGSLLQAWFRHHYPALRVKIAIKAAGMDARGVARMILSGDCVGILPDHLVAERQSASDAFEVISSRRPPLRNTISVAFLAERTQSAATLEVMKWLKKRLK